MRAMRHGESEFDAVHGVTRTDPEIRGPKLTARRRADGCLASASVIASADLGKGSTGNG